MSVINRMSEIIGLAPIADKIEFICDSVVDCDAYTRSKIEYLVNGRNIPAFLLIPKGEGPFPAVLVNHQHHSQRNWGKSEVCGLVGDPLQDFGSKLARAGFVVIAPDAICFEERSKRSGYGRKSQRRRMESFPCVMSWYFDRRNPGENCHRRCDRCNKCSERPEYGR